MNYEAKVNQLDFVERRKSEANKIHIQEGQCIFCGEMEETREFKGKYVCSNRIDHVWAELNLSNN